MSARELATRHPAAMIACPLCASGVKGANLASHLAKVHPGAPSQPSTRWRGADRASRAALLALPVGWAAVVFALAMTSSDVADALGWALGLGAVVSLIPVTLSAFELLPASLEIDGDRIRLTFALGLITRELRPIGPVEVGRLRELRPSAIAPTHESGGEEVSSGYYLGLAAEGRAVTVGTRAGTAFRKHWAPEGWRAGPPRRRWDITIDRIAMVQLEHHLASAGLLTPRD